MIFIDKTLPTFHSPWLTGWIGLSIWKWNNDESNVNAYKPKFQAKNQYEKERQCDYAFEVP